MSIRIMAEVYDSDLSDIYEHAVMLALANHADDQGVCYPSMARIARLARCSERKAQGVVKALSERGYIEIEPNAGPKGCNIFHLNPAGPRTACTPHDVHPAPCAPRTPRQGPPHATTGTPAQRAPEPSGNITKPSLSLVAREAETSPFDEFNAIAAQVGWPEVQSRSQDRLRSAKARMKDCGGFGNWKAAMERAAQSDFLSGKSTGSTPATFDWLNKPTNFRKLMEGNYDNRDRQPQQSSDRRKNRPDAASLTALRLAGLGGT